MTAGVIELNDLCASYDGRSALNGISLTIPPGHVVSIVGPSGCGKSTLLRALNRLTPSNCKTTGSVTLDGDELRRMDPVLLRRRIGMVFQKPNPFPMSIRENVVYGLKAQGRRRDLDSAVRASLAAAALWDEVADRLHHSALGLSLGQQQRLCIARALAVSPEVLLMDEPAASLDPTSTAQLEASIVAMKGTYTVVVVTHDIGEARRISDLTAYLRDGEIVEFGETERLFTAPQYAETAAYLRSGNGVLTGTGS